MNPSVNAWLTGAKGCAGVEEVNCAEAACPAVKKIGIATRTADEQRMAYLRVVDTSRAKDFNPWLSCQLVESRFLTCHWNQVEHVPRHVAS